VKYNATNSRVIHCSQISIVVFELFLKESVQRIHVSREDLVPWIEDSDKGDRGDAIRIFGSLI